MAFYIYDRDEDLRTLFHEGYKYRFINMMNGIEYYQCLNANCTEHLSGTGYNLRQAE
jgi:hypothetical protein